MRQRAARLAALAGLLLFIALASTAAAANASVEIAGFAFDPQSLTINVGDTVTWTNRDQAAHSAAFAGGPKTPVLTNGKSASLTFTTAGTLDYVCGIHGASMPGTIIVRAAATQPPTAPPPTIAPTPVPTARPTVAPTVAPTEQPTPSESPTVTATAATSAAPSATAAPTVALAVPTQQAPAPASSNEGSGPNAVLIGGAAIALIAVVAAALARIRR